MHYLGSKKKLLPFIQKTIGGVVGTDLSRTTFCDLFAGAGNVGRAFKTGVHEIISNDMEYYSFVLNRNYIGNHKDIPDGQQYIDELNRLPLIHNGFIYRHYCKGGGTGRQYFSDDNGKKIDTIRQGIEELKRTANIADDLYYFLLASLLESADKLANTTACYTAYLKHLDPKSQKPLILQPADFAINANTHRVFNENADTLIKNISGDVLYADPPYNHRQYGGDYHLLNTIARYDDFIPVGLTGRRVYQKSDWGSCRKVENTLDNLLRDAQFKYIFLSYNNEGIMSPETIKEAMSKHGRYDCVSTEHKRFKSSQGEHKAKKTVEYIHILEKR
jgi:adenine-specific DNA-methyltransferase